MPAVTYPQAPLPEGFNCTSINCKGMELKVVSGGTGPLILFLHGLGGSSEDFYPVMSRLFDGFECIAIDFPGFGFSTKPDVDYGIDFFCMVVQEVMAQLPARPQAVAGHSMGGHVVLKYSIDHPGQLDKVIAICPAGGHTSARWYHRLLFTFWVKDGDRLRHVRPIIMKHIAMWPFADRTSDICRMFGEKFIAQWYDGQTHNREVALVRSGRSILENPIWQDAGSITSQVLMITGAQDHITPTEDTERLASAMNGVKNIIVDQGHMAIYTNADQVSDAIAAFMK